MQFSKASDKAHMTHPLPFNLLASARQSLLENGFEPDFPVGAALELSTLKANPPRIAPSDDVRDLRSMLWSSIDNDTSRDLDQIEVAESLPDGTIRVLIGIADVDAFVHKGMIIDRFAARQTATIYTEVKNFSMLPEQLSTDQTSLLENADKLSVVIEFAVGKDGSVQGGTAYRAVVRNQFQLAYNGIGAWLEGKAAAPPKVAASSAIQAQLKLQDEAAHAMRAARFRAGALSFEKVETHPVFADGQIVGLELARKNRATELIEDFMVAANGVMARLLLDHHLSSIRRVVRTPERWDRIVELAAQHGGNLPPEPDSKALSDFLEERRKADPEHFVDVSLIVVKLMGPGEYVMERPGDPEIGHFGLAVQDYTHSTAPNRRFPDLVAQRQVKAMLAKQDAPYSDQELASIAENCTVKEHAIRKVTREMSKRIAAVALQKDIGKTFGGIVTGVTPKGTFVRVMRPPAEGRVMRGERGMDVGDRVQVKLVGTDPQRGFIDFVRA
jgi:VacB/RNase II family 3'-5' exoribonuclease